MKNKYTLILLIFSSVIVSQSHSVHQLGNSSEPYVTGDDGIVRMYVNVLGHVKNPGTFLVYESIDIFSLLALAGGPLPGAELKNIKQFHNDEVKYLDFQKYLDTGRDIGFILYPHNTIYIEQTFGSYLLSNSSFINSTLSLLNIYLTIKNQMN